MPSTSTRKRAGSSALSAPFSASGGGWRLGRRALHEGRLLALAQLGHHHPGRVGHDVVVLEGVHPDLEVPVGQEVEVAAVGVEARVEVVVEVVGELDLPALERVVEQDRVVAVLAGEGVGDPAAVRRPGVVADLPGELVVVEVARLVDLRPLLRGDVHDEEREVLVAEQDLLAVGRPAQVVDLAVEVGRSLRRLAGRRRRARRAGTRRSRRRSRPPLPVGREARGVLAHARRCRSGCGARLLVREGQVEHVAPGRDDQGLAVAATSTDWMYSDGLIQRSCRRQSSDGMRTGTLRGVAVRLHHVQVAALDEDDALAVGRGRLTSKSVNGSPGGRRPSSGPAPTGW